jgi:NADPH-dependent 7-cyano-7-deazaguanine reductase QueF
VTAEFAVRGGIAISVEAEYPENKNKSMNTKR